MLTVPHKITAMKFMTEDTLVLVLTDCSVSSQVLFAYGKSETFLHNLTIQVQFYDIPSNALVHNIRLTHPISSMDVWNGYLLIGSSVVHMVDTGQWRRTVVVDMQEQDSVQVGGCCILLFDVKRSFQSPRRYLAVFNKITGEFVTSTEEGSVITFWPKPHENCGGPMTTSINRTVCDGRILM